MKHLKSFEQNKFVTRAVLKNGLTVLVNEYHNSPAVALLAFVKSGYSGDPESRIGISRLVQRMLFKSSPSDGVGPIARDTQTLGGVLHNLTNFDHTAYSLVVPSAQWKKAMEIQADLLLDEEFREDQLKRQISFMREERGALRLNTRDVGYHELLALSFDRTRQRRLGIGRFDTLENVELQEVRGYYRAKYIPRHLILVISGDINTAEVLNKIVDLYRGMRGSARPINSGAAGRTSSGYHYRQVRGDIENPRVWLGFHTAPVGSKDYPALEMLRAILGLGEGSVLNRRLRDENQVILSSDIQGLSNRRFGYLSLELVVRAGDVDRSEIAAFTEFELLKRQEPNKSEMARALAQLEREYWIGTQTISRRAGRLAYFESLGNWKGIDDHVNRLRQVKPADISHVAKAYLKIENCALLEYLPDSMEPRNLTADGVKNILVDLLAPSTAEESAKREKETVPAYDLPSSSRFVYNEVRHPMRKASILRGPELYIREDHTLPLVQMGFFLAGGKLQETKENGGITALMLRLLLRSAEDRETAEVIRQLEIYGAEFSPVVADDYFGVSFTVLSHNIQKGMELLIEMLTSLQFETEDFERQMELQKVDVAEERQVIVPAVDSPEALHLGTHGLQLREALFQEHPYGRSRFGHESSLDSITPDDVRAWHRDTVVNRKPIVVIVGDTKGTELAAYFVRNYSGSRYRDVEIPEIYPKSLEKKARIQSDWDLSRSLIIKGYQAPSYQDEDLYTLAVLQSYASGIAGQLQDQLRDRQGLVHNVSLEYLPRWRGGEVRIWATTDPGKEDAVEKALNTEILRIFSTPISYKDYRSAVNTSIGIFWIEQQDRMAQIANQVRNILSRRGTSGVEEYAQSSIDVRQEDLPVIAKRIFNEERSVTITVRGKSAP